MRWRSMVSVGVVFLALTLPMTGHAVLKVETYAQGQEALKRRDYAAAWRIFKPLAVAGGAEAQTAVGELLEKGHGDKDGLDALVDAAMWFRMAAEQHHAPAQFHLGAAYLHGHGLAQSDKEAAVWFGKAATQGFAPAQFNVGVMAFDGRGMPRDAVQGANWIAQAAAQGHAKAQYTLGRLYSQGTGVPQNALQSEQWLGKAAEQGLPEARAALALMGAGGDAARAKLEEAAERGHPPALQALARQHELAGRLAHAYVLFSIAARSVTSEDRARVARHLSMDELKRAEAMARAWQPGSALPAQSP